MSDGWNVRVNSDEAERQLRFLAVHLADLRSFWPMVIPLATSWWRRQFETEGEFGGKPWEQLSPVYASTKAQRAPGKGLLVFSGAMKQAVSRPARMVTPTTLVLSIESDVLPYHQEGTDKMPARPVVFGSPLPLEAEAELAEVANRYVSDILGRF